MESASKPRPRPTSAVDASVDAGLVARIREGDERAFEALFRTYAGSLCRLAHHYVNSVAMAEEVVQDVLLRVWEGRATLAVRENLPGYLRVAVRNQALDNMKAARSAARVHRAGHAPDSQVPVGMGQPAPSPFDDAEHNELAAALRHAVERLPARCRLVFVLRWESHLSYAEIAEHLDISVKAVERHRERALKRLAKGLRQFLP
jgi:RNA polymerase sigma-70 factor (ECF subfamily)